MTFDSNYYHENCSDYGTIIPLHHKDQPGSEIQMQEKTKLRCLETWTSKLKEPEMKTPRTRDSDPRIRNLNARKNRTTTSRDLKPWTQRTRTRNLKTKAPDPRTRNLDAKKDRTPISTDPRLWTQKTRNRNPRTIDPETKMKGTSKDGLDRHKCLRLCM